MVGQSIDLPTFAFLFSSPIKVPERLVYRRRALHFCLYTQFLFTSRSRDIGQRSVVAVARRGLEGRDPTPLVVGETMVGLDLLQSDPSLELAGSPVLLQVCFLDYFKHYEC